MGKKTALNSEILDAYEKLWKNGDDADMLKIIKSGIPIDGPCNEEGDTLLHDTAYYANDNTETFEWLIKYGKIDPNVKNNAGWTPLDCVPWKGFLYKFIKQSGGKHSWKYYFWLQDLNR